MIILKIPKNIQIFGSQDEWLLYNQETLLAIFSNCEDNGEKYMYTPSTNTREIHTGDNNHEDNCKRYAHTVVPSFFNALDRNRKQNSKKLIAQITHIFESK